MLGIDNEIVNYIKRRNEMAKLLSKIAGLMEITGVAVHEPH